MSGMNMVLWPGYATDGDRLGIDIFGCYVTGNRRSNSIQCFNRITARAT